MKAADQHRFTQNMTFNGSQEVAPRSFRTKFELGVQCENLKGMVMIWAGRPSPRTQIRVLMFQIHHLNRPIRELGDRRNAFWELVRGSRNIKNEPVKDIFGSPFRELSGSCITNAKLIVPAGTCDH